MRRRLNAWAVEKLLRLIRWLDPIHVYVFLKPVHCERCNFQSSNVHDVLNHHQIHPNRQFNVVRRLS